MSRKYMEFVKAGRYVVPVEIALLPIDTNENGIEIHNSNWAAAEHWMEIKALLKPVVDLCTSSSDGFPRTPRISYGHEIGLGYVLCTDSLRERPLLSFIMESKSRGEDEEDDVHLGVEGLRDYGGKHRLYVTTKVYVKAAVIKRTSSATNDTKKLKSELGFSGGDLRSYFQTTIQTG